MAQPYIYIDDSGTPSLTDFCSEKFVIAAVVVKCDKDKELLEKAVANFCAKYKKGENFELKFSKLRKDIIREAIREIKTEKFEIYAAILDKRKIKNSLVKREEDIMLYVIKELIIKLKIENPNIIIDGVHGSSYIKRARPYIRKSLKLNGITKSNIDFKDSVKYPIIQVADLAAGSIARSFSDKTDASDYRKLFGNKIKKIYRI